MTERGPGTGGPERVELYRSLRRRPVIATLFGPALVGRFLDSSAELAIIANIELLKLRPLLAMIGQQGKQAFVNIDSCPGLAQDRGGLDFLRTVDAFGVVSTRPAVVQQGAAAGLATIRKVFLTDRSNLPRSSSSVASSGADLVQLMPWPVLPHVGPDRLKPFTPYIAGGFVSSPDDVRRALATGAIGVSTSDDDLWDTPPER